MASEYILWKRWGKNIFFWSVGVLGVLVPTKNLSFLCTCCDHFHILGRAVRCIGELGGGAHCWLQHWALFPGSSVHFQIWKWGLLQMNNSNKMGEITQEKIGDGAHYWWWCWAVLSRYSAPFQMESMAMLNKKSNKIGKNHKNKGGWCSLLMMMFEVLFLRSSVHFQIQKVWLC